MNIGEEIRERERESWVHVHSHEVQYCSNSCECWASQAPCGPGSPEYCLNEEDNQNVLQAIPLACKPLPGLASPVNPGNLGTGDAGRAKPSRRHHPTLRSLPHRHLRWSLEQPVAATGEGSGGATSSLVPRVEHGWIWLWVGVRPGGEAMDLDGDWQQRRPLAQT
jgi:hypothetical protein